MIKLNPPERSTMASELEKFKTDIDLRAYAAAQGYELDVKCIWHGSAVMRHGNGDKIIISREEDGHYVYWSVRDDSDHGTIVDFVMCRQNSIFEFRLEVPRNQASVSSPPSSKTNR